VGDQGRTTPALLLSGIWRRRKWLGLFVFTSALTGAVSAAAFLPDVYRSTTTLLVEHLALAGSNAADDLETPLRTLSQEILSRARLNTLITRLDLYPELRRRVPPEVVIERMRRDIRIDFRGAEPVRGPSATVAFTLSYRGNDPAKVAQVANTLGAFYVQGRPWWLRSRLARLKQELSERRSRFTERHPDVVQARIEVEAVERQLAAAEDGEATWVPGSPLPRGSETVSDDRHAQRGELRAAQFRILDPAIPSERPVVPNRVRLGVVGLVLAAGMAVAVAVLTEWLDTSFHTAEDLQGFTRVPILASIPWIVMPGNTGRRLRQLGLAGAAVGLSLVLMVGAAYYVAHDNQDLALMLTPVRP